MRMKWWVVVGLLLVFSRAYAGTFTTADTLIPVADKADATPAGDTTPAAGAGIIHLDARIYIPDGLATPAPVIVVVPPFGGSKDSGFVIALAQDFATQGYVVLTPTLRGFGNSEGLVTFAGPNEINDLKTMILAMENGVIGDSPAVAIPVSGLSKFGMTGASYGGGHSFEIIRTHVPGLAAVAPIIGWSDLYQALSPNDVPKFSYVVGLFASGFDPQNPNYDDQLFDRTNQLLSGNPEAARTGDSDGIDWRSVIFNPTELTVPVFVIQGWRDWLFPAEQAISLFQSSTNIPFFKLYIGGLGHAPATADITTPEAMYLQVQLVRWFDYWLKGTANGIVTEPNVTIGPELTADWSEGALVSSNTFPVPGSGTITFTLNGFSLSGSGPGGRANTVHGDSVGPAIFAPIESALGGGSTGFITAIAAANDLINAGGDVLSPSIVTDIDQDAKSVSFSTGALPQDLHVMGVPQVSLSVSASAGETYYYVQIIERLADGSTRLVTRGAFKDHTAKFKKVHQIDLSLFALNHVFKAGSKIGLRIASRDFPFFLPNLDQGTFKISHGKRNPSSLTLPFVP
ncbi:MAG TPA: CocE/NonD family hydrolase [Chthoniobacterales bacterium]